MVSYLLPIKIVPEPKEHSAPSDINDVLNTDLELTENFLRLHPKIYVIWNHRRWCLEHIPEGPEDDRAGWKTKVWNRELRTVEMMLNADARNCM